MTSFVMDEPTFTSHASIPSKVLSNDRNTIKPGPKNKVLRLDSPTTLQACKDLGILPNDLKQKTLEDFKDSKVQEQIVEVRFKHYLKRYNQTVKDVMAKKKEISRKLKYQEEHQLDQQQLPESPKNKTFITSYHIAPKRAGTAGGSPQSFRTSFFPLSPVIPTKMVKSFNKTMSYFKKSMDSADITSGEHILGIDDTLPQSPKSSVDKFRKTLSEEVFKFNKTKEQKQREAKLIYEEELSRCKKIEEMQEKEKNREEKQRKLLLERKKKEVENKKMQEEKAERIKEMDINFKLFKEEEKERNELRLDEVRRKFQEEMEEKKRKQAEKDQMIQIKRKQVLEKKQKLLEDELKTSDQLKFQIIGKLSAKESNHKMALNERSLRASMQLSRIDETIDKYKEKTAQDVENSVNKIVSKIVKKQNTIRALSEQHVKHLKKKELEEAEKEKRHTSNHFHLEEDQKEKMNEINERFKKVQDNLEAKREADEQKRILKQELSKLKIDDKLENHARIQRQLENERLRIIEKGRHEEERIYILKSQKELVQQAKREAKVHAIFEKQKIDGSVQQLTRSLYSSKSTRAVNEHQKKLLKNLLRPADYYLIEEEERRKEAERKALLEQQENGTIPRKAQSLSRKAY